jgi:hypothetical protein
VFSPVAPFPQEPPFCGTAFPALSGTAPEMIYSLLYYIIPVPAFQHFCDIYRQKVSFLWVKV